MHPSHPTYFRRHCLRAGGVSVFLRWKDGLKQCINGVNELPTDELRNDRTTSLFNRSEGQVHPPLTSVHRDDIKRLECLLQVPVTDIYNKYLFSSLKNGRGDGTRDDTETLDSEDWL